MITDEDQAAEPSEETEAPAPKPRKAKPKKATPAEGKAKGNGKAAKPAKAAAKAAKPGAGKGKAAKPSKLRERDPSKLDAYGYRKGSTRSLAAALYATKKGATLAETKERFGTVQFNVLTEVQKRGHKVTTKDERNDNGRTVKRFFLAAA